MNIGTIKDKKKPYNDGRKIDYFEHKIWKKLLLVYLVFLLVFNI